MMLRVKNQWMKEEQFIQNAMQIIEDVHSLWLLWWQLYGATPMYVTRGRRMCLITSCNLCKKNPL